ncbi:hypothetical protein [Burkholderia ambifaria]|uniref:hypothetical protein n=1 Tax=Burkholderia ambifaria TaxID=152480 RepID=UPI0012FE0AB8|nr:hypothetical protein [Burkholderia ambifaria]
MKKTLAAIALAAVTAHAAAEDQLLNGFDITWQKDGQTLIATTHYFTDPSGRLIPFRKFSGQSVGYATCTMNGPATTLTSNAQTVGTALVLSPSSAADGSIAVTIEAEDTSLVGIKEVESGPCKSQVVETRGMPLTRLTAKLAKKGTTVVQFPAGHYELRLTALDQ